MLSVGLGMAGLAARRKGAPQALAAPVNVSLPVISGTPHVGETLTASTGAWTGNPAPTYAYQWRRGAVNISGATASTYVVQAGDDQTNLDVVVTATNSEGSAGATSSTVAVTYAPPSVDSASISPTSGVVGDTFTASYTASGGAATISYQWELDGVTIGGATASTYQTIAAGELTVVITATNSGGTDFLESAAATVSSVGSQALPPMVLPTASGELTVTW